MREIAEYKNMLVFNRELRTMCKNYFNHCLLHLTNDDGMIPCTRSGQATTWEQEEGSSQQLHKDVALYEKVVITCVRSRMYTVCNSSHGIF